MGYCIMYGFVSRSWSYILIMRCSQKQSGSTKSTPPSCVKSYQLIKTTYAAFQRGGRQKCDRPTRLFYKSCIVGVLMCDSGPQKHALELKKVWKILDFAQKDWISMVWHSRSKKWNSGLLIVFSSFYFIFSVCYKCKIRFRTYGIHRNIKIWT